MNKVLNIFGSQILIITSGTGSFGNAVLRRFLDSDLREIRIFSRDEKEQDDIVIGLPMTHATSNDTNPFAVKFTSAKGEVGYVLAHQPKSFDWRKRGARPHPWKQVLPTVFESACEELNGIISIG